MTEVVDGWQVIRYKLSDFRFGADYDHFRCPNCGQIDWVPGQGRPVLCRRCRNWIVRWGNLMFLCQYVGQDRQGTNGR